MSVEKALEAVRDGRIILIYDFDDREGESDMTVASQFVTHEKIRTMRKDAGGLLCTIAPYGLARAVGLPFLSDVFWGDLDVLLLDLPPGTGDVTISVAQLLPSAEIIVVTTPQTAAAEVAERTGLIAAQTHQKVVGVIENMSYLIQPDGSHLEIFGSGGGRTVSRYVLPDWHGKEGGYLSVSERGCTLHGLPAEK